MLEQFGGFLLELRCSSFFVISRTRHVARCYHCLLDGQKVIYQSRFTSHSPQPTVDPVSGSCYPVLNISGFVQLEVDRGVL